MTTLYKLTNQNLRTYDGFQWEVGKRFKATGPRGTGLCSPEVIHVYENAALALFMNPIHANFVRPRLFEANGKIVVRDSQLKAGVRQLTLIRELHFSVSLEQRVAFAIFCAQSACGRPSWNKWATNWLSGKDRSRAAAARAARAACATTAASAHAACAASAYAASAADAAEAADAAAAYAARAARAARAATYAARATTAGIDLFQVADRAAQWVAPK